jgi:Holliday junction resolvase
MTPEGILKSKVVKMLESGGYYVIRNLQGGIQHVKNHPGISDLTVIKNGIVTFIEIKTPEGKHREEQLVFMYRLVDAGGRYVTIRSEADAAEFIRGMRPA